MVMVKSPATKPMIAKVSAVMGIACVYVIEKEVWVEGELFL